MSKDSRNGYINQHSYEAKNGSGYQQKADNGYKMQDKIALQKQRIGDRNENIHESSPDINQRRLNGKAGVQLAPLNGPPPVVGR